MTTLNRASTSEQPETAREEAKEALENARDRLQVALPEPNLRLSQDEEWVVVEHEGRWRRIGMHDYGGIYDIPGLYERIIYDILQCGSPQMVRSLLADQLGEEGVDPKGLTVLDLGAGNGCVAEELRRIGIRRFVGIDICPEAKVAAERDRPGLYEDYVAEDLTDLSEEARKILRPNRFDALTCVAALGFADIPPRVFAEAFNMVRDGGWIVFTIKSDFIDDHSDDTGFARFIRSMTGNDVLELKRRKRYTHRVSTAGTPLEYVCFVGVKKSDVELPDEE